MVMTFKALSALLCYPSEELQTSVVNFCEVIRSEQLVDPTACFDLEQFIAEFPGSDLFELQERYVELFDKTRRLSLHLFEHVHGESRDRGQAMVDLAALYEAGGLQVAANELPDYLPLLLEYLSTRPLDEARDLLRNALPIIVTLEERLQGRNSSYAAVFSAIRSVSKEDLLVSEVAGTAEPEQPEANDLAALDAAWEETAVTFGPGDALDGCSVDRLRIQMRAARRDARQTTA
jgi:nitrate reductase delta subunit